MSMEESLEKTEYLEETMEGRLSLEILVKEESSLGCSRSGEGVRRFSGDGVGASGEGDGVFVGDDVFTVEPFLSRRINDHSRNNILSII